MKNILTRAGVRRRTVLVQYVLLLHSSAVPQLSHDRNVTNKSEVLDFDEKDIDASDMNVPDVDMQEPKTEPSRVRVR